MDEAQGIWLRWSGWSVVCDSDDLVRVMFRAMKDGTPIGALTSDTLLDDTRMDDGEYIH